MDIHSLGKCNGDPLQSCTIFSTVAKYFGKNVTLSSKWRAAIFSLMLCLPLLLLTCSYYHYIASITDLIMIIVFIIIIFILRFCSSLASPLSSLSLSLLSAHFYFPYSLISLQSSLQWSFSSPLLLLQPIP